MGEKITDNKEAMSNAGQVRSRGSFVRSTAIMVAGSGVAQAITLLAMPIITRLFSPADFGLFATVVALAAPFAAIASYRYSETIMLVKTEREAQLAFHLSSGLVVINSLILLVIVVVFEEPLSAVFELNGHREYLYAVPVMVLLTGVWRVFDMRLQRGRQFGRIAGVTVAGAVADRVVTLVAGFGSATPWGLIGGRLTGMVAAIVLMMERAPVDDSGSREDATADATWRSIAADYSSFARYSWSGFLVQLVVNLPVLVIGSFFGATIVGLFALARRVLLEPTTLVGRALSKTFYERATSLIREGRSIAGVSKALLEYLLKFSLPPMAMVAVVAPEAFGIVFGVEWREAGVYAILLSPVFLSTFVTQPMNRLFSVLQRQRASAGFSLLSLAGISIGLAGGVIANDPKVTCVFMSVIVTLLTTIRIRWLLIQVGLQPGAIYPAILKHVAVAVVLSVPLLLLRLTSEASDLVLFLSASVLCVSYLAYAVLTDRRFTG